MPQRTLSITEKIAFSILADQGVAAIWKLQECAAEAHRLGFPRSAEAILEIAEAAEQAWLSAGASDDPSGWCNRIPRLEGAAWPL